MFSLEMWKFFQTAVLKNTQTSACFSSLASIQSNFIKTCLREIKIYQVINLSSL